MIHKIAFSGTREGMSPRQLEYLEILLEGLRIKGQAQLFYEGDCVGADVEATQIAQKLGYTIEVCAANDTTTRAFYAPVGHYYRQEPKPALKRNKFMVDKADLLIAAPLGNFEQRRSGTWAAIRYARKTQKQFIRLLR